MPKALGVGHVILRLQYQERRQRGEDLPALSDVEVLCDSQNEEGGILLYIFSVLGTTDRRVVENGAGDGTEGMPRISSSTTASKVCCLVSEPSPWNVWILGFRS
jgi:hypothetical protein